VRRALLLAFLTLAAPHTPALSIAQASGNDSLEVMVHKHPAVCRGRVVQEGDKYAFLIAERFKGPLGGKIPVTPVKDHAGFDTPYTGFDVVAFLDYADDDAADRTWRVAFFIPYLYSYGPAMGWSMDFTRSRTPDELFTVLRRAAADTPTDPRRPTVSTPGGRRYPHAPAFRLPRTARAHRLALDWARSPDPHVRLRACDLLAQFPSPESSAALRALLGDPHTDPQRHVRGGTRQLYAVRLAAVLGLRELNERFEEPALETPSWPRALADDNADVLAALAIGVVAPPITYALGRHLRRRRGRFVERPSVLRLTFAALALGSALLAIALAYAWLIGLRDVRSFTRMNRDGPSWGALTHEGKLQLLWRSESPLPFSTADWGLAYSDWIGRLSARDPGVHTFGGGFVYATQADVPSSAPRSHVLQLPFWSAVTLASILPLIWLLRQRRYARRRHRAANNLCLACGYDLRHSPDRCPECGEARTGPLEITPTPS
jgi:hypothetical protein